MTEENGTDQQPLTVISNGTLDHDTHQHSDPSPTSLKMLLECGPNSTIERQIQRVLRKHFLEQRAITWKPTRVELVVNTQLTDDFFAIRKRFEKASAGNRCEFDEHFAFLIETDSQCLDICQNGYHAVESAFNVLGHSKGGVYVCKYADVCIRHASVRRTWEGNVIIKMIIFKIVQGKQTAALVRKGPKLQPIAPTPQFTSHSSVITPKETDDLEKQFDQSQIFLYDFEGRETVKRPHHCLPYAIVSWIQDGSQWPANFDDLDTESDILETDTLRVTALTDDPLLQSKLKENLELAEAATRALEHVYEEEPPPPSAPVEEKALSPPLNTETLQTTTTTTTADNPSITATNGTGSVSSPTTSTDNLSTTSPPPNSLGSSTNDGSTIPPPPPPPATLIAVAKTPAAAVATTIPLAHSAAAVQAAYRQQSSLLGALPNVGGLRAAPGGMYATSAGLANGLTGQIIYGGISMDALRAYQSSGSSPYIFASHGGQQMQQPALYAAQLQAVAQQQQAAQLAAVAQQQQQQQQQQNLLNSVPAGYMLVRTANGGYALLAQSQAAALQAQAQAQSQQQYITVNAAGQATAANARVPMAMVGGQGQQIFYQYAGQPTIQAGATQYIQVPANYAQQQQPLSTSPVLQTAAVYPSQTSAQYIGASQGSTANSNGSASTPTGSVQGTSAIISPQKQSAASATAAAIQQQQQYQHSQQTQQQQQQQQQQAMQGAHGTNVYYAAIAQAQAQLTAQVQAQQQAVAAATLAQQQQQQQQQQLNLLSQFQYGNQQGVPQQMYYTSAGGQTIYQAGGQSYVLAPAGTNTGASTTTGAPVMYSAGPVLHNGAGQQQSQGQLAYQLAAGQGQGAGAAYQMISAASTVPTQATSSAGVVAQQPAQLVQRSTVLPPVRHHPYRS